MDTSSHVHMDDVLAQPKDSGVGCIQIILGFILAFTIWIWADSMLIRRDVSELSDRIETIEKTILLMRVESQVMIQHIEKALKALNPEGK